MEKFNRSILRSELTLDEGLRLKVYRCTENKRTIGVGRNLDAIGIRSFETEQLGITVASCVANGITKSQALILLDNDITACEASLDRYLPWWRTLDPVRQRVMLNMTFNMGLDANPKNGGFDSFVNTLNLIKVGQYENASQNMLRSKWADQVGKRAIRLAMLMRLGPKTA